MRKEDKLYTVYRLENVVTKKNYIGMTSQEPKERWCRGYHGKMGDAINNYPFDLCWKKHIEFQTPNKNQALELEAELMKWYDSIENGYNISSYSGGTYKRSDETRRKISESQIGEKNNMYGKHHSEESKKRMSELKTGIHHSEESKKKIAESRGVDGVIQYSKSGEFIAEYYSLNEASRQTGCNLGHICSCCRGERKSTGGFIWQYKSNTN